MYSTSDLKMWCGSIELLIVLSLSELILLSIYDDHKLQSMFLKDNRDLGCEDLLLDPKVNSVNVLRSNLFVVKWITVNL